MQDYNSNEKVVSVREVQRNYRALVDEVNRTKKPIFLGARSKREAVLLAVDVFEDMQKNGQTKNKPTWAEMKKRLDWIASGGKQNTNLAKFIHEDRQRH